MEYLDRPFEVSTRSGRRPTPLTYEHLRDYPALVKQYLKMSSQTDIINVNELLNLTGNLYVSNEISRVIAQLIGELEPGFITIKGSPGGGLYVSILDGLAPLLTGIILAAGSNLIGSVKVTGRTQTILSKPFHVNTSPTSMIIPAASGVCHHICSLAFTVAGEVNITFNDEGTGLSGAMDFGASGEPKGMTHSFGLAPLPCAEGKKFEFDLSGAVYVDGVVTYYDE